MEKCFRVKRATDGNKTRNMHIACWIIKVTNTHSEYTLLTVFPLQQRLRQSAAVVCYTYVASLVPDILNGDFIQGVTN